METLFARNDLGLSTTYEDALENQLENCLLPVDVELLKMHLFLGRLLVECIYDLLIWIYRTNTELHVFIYTSRRTILLADSDIWLVLPPNHPEYVYCSNSNGNTRLCRSIRGYAVLLVTLSHKCWLWSNS